MVETHGRLKPESIALQKKRKLDIVKVKEKPISRSQFQECIAQLLWCNEEKCQSLPHLLTLTNKHLVDVKENVTAFLDHRLDRQILANVFSLTHFIMHHPGKQRQRSLFYFDFFFQQDDAVPVKNSFISLLCYRSAT